VRVTPDTDILNPGSPPRRARPVGIAAAAARSDFPTTFASLCARTGDTAADVSGTATANTP
ncbi:MAG: hypothetical protein ACRDRL_32660, partial [Sciscionella sp.]